MILSYIVVFRLIPILFSYKEMLTTSWMVQILAAGTNNIKCCTMRIRISDSTSVSYMLGSVPHNVYLRKDLGVLVTANSSFIVTLHLLLLKLIRSWAIVSSLNTSTMTLYLDFTRLWFAWFLGYAKPHLHWWSENLTSTIVEESDILWKIISSSATILVLQKKTWCITSNHVNLELTPILH